MEAIDPNHPAYTKSEPYEKCQHCQRKCFDHELETHVPSGMILCDDCLQDYCRTDEEENANND